MGVGPLAAQVHQGETWRALYAQRRTIVITFAFAIESLLTIVAASQVESGMDAPTSDKEIQSPPEAPSAEGVKNAQAVTRIPAIIVGIVAAFVVALSLFYLLRPEPLLVQGEADATRFDIAARVDGRVREISAERGQNVPAAAVLVRIDNPETVAKLECHSARNIGSDALLVQLISCQPDARFEGVVVSALQQVVDARHQDELAGDDFGDVLV